MKRHRSSFSETFFPLNLKNLAIFAAIWLFISFATGTSTLMGPVRWVTDIGREQGLSGEVESWIVRAVIVAYIGATFVLSLFLARSFARSSLRHLRVLLIGIPFLCAAGSLWLFLNPELMGIHRGMEEAVSARFTFGPFPTEDKLAELKSRGFTGVISLLHPAVVPFEPKLLADETDAARSVGIRLIHVPMLPWVGDNEDSLSRLRELAASDEGRYYVHCYLGKDRVRVAANLIRSVDPGAAILPDSTGRQLQGVRRLERGPIILLDEEIYIAPYPTEEEFLSYVLNGNIAQVVSLMDPGQEANREWIDREKALLERYEMPYLALPLPLDPVDPEAIEEIVSRIHSLPRPLLVHDFLVPSPAVETLLGAYAGLPPLNYSRLNDSMVNGRPYFVGDTVLFGPRPTRSETGRLYRLGIRHLGFVGNVENASGDQSIWDSAVAAGLDLSFVAPDDFKAQRKAADGEAWYFYGPEIRSRNLAQLDYFEGEPIRRARRGILLTAPPRFDPVSNQTRELILESPLSTVIALLNPQDPKEAVMIQAARAHFSRRGIDYQVLPFARLPFDPARAVDIAARIYGEQQPVLVYSTSMNDPRLQGVYMALQTGQPPAVPILLERELRQGPVKVPAPNFAVGPRPMAPEFVDPLYNAGIRSFVLLDDADSAQALVDRTIVTKAGLNWRVMDPDEENIFSIIYRGGPWYVYGDSEVERRLQSPLVGPPMPITSLNHVFSREAAGIKRVEESIRVRIVNFVRAAIPSLRLIILATPMILIYTYLAAAYASRLRMDRNIRTPYTRKVFHFIIFTGACAIQLSFGLSAVVLYGSLVVAAVLYAVWRGDGFGFYEALARPTDAPRRSLFIIVPLITTALGGVFANLFFGKFAVVGYLVGGWGDAIGEPVGARWGNHKYRVPSLAGVPATRSLEGSFAVVVVSFLAAALALAGLGHDWPTVARVAALCAVGSALVEAVSNHGLDNLTIQVTAAGICYALMA